MQVLHRLVLVLLDLFRFLDLLRVEQHLLLWEGQTIIEPIRCIDELLFGEGVPRVLHLAEDQLQHPEELGLQQGQVDALGRDGAVGVGVKAAEDVREVLNLQLFDDGLALVVGVRASHLEHLLLVLYTLLGIEAFLLNFALLVEHVACGTLLTARVWTILVPGATTYTWTESPWHA